MTLLDSETLVRKKTPNFTFGVFLLFLLFASPSLCSSDNTANQTDLLMLDLFKEGNWTACRVECRRLIVVQPDHHGALLLKAVSELRSGIDSTSALKDIAETIDTEPNLVHMARYELGREYWKQKEIVKAATCFTHVFEHAASQDLFLRAGCSLSILIHETPSLGEDFPALRTQLESCYALWTEDIIASCRLATPKKKPSIASRPAKWIITFYQAQIGPAIGSRCSLTPSCSAYAVQALNKHGVLGVAMAGDRLVREPTVVAEKKKVIRQDGKKQILDPVADHDLWMGGKK